MPSQPNLLQTAVAAIQQQRYADAVQALEAFCSTQAMPHSKDLFQAQMYLVKAYQENHQLPQAIALCQQMAASNHPKVRAWAERILPTLSGASSQPTAPNTTKPAPEPTPSPASPQAWLAPEAAAQLLNSGNQALKTRKFAQAVTDLEAYCQGTDPGEKDYAQAQMWLAKAYKGNQQPEAAIALGKQLLNHEKEYVQIWAKQFLLPLAPDAVEEATPQEAGTAEPAFGGSPGSRNSFSRSSKDRDPENASASIPKAGRANRPGVKLSMKGIAANLALASGATLSLLSGMVLVLSLALLLIVDSENPFQGLLIAVAITVIFNLVVFFLAPIIMDLVQGWLYGTRWTTLSEIARYSPETARVITEVCQKKKLSEPRLGIIEDNNPTAFTYGSLPNSARLVVSRGIFTYLDEDEIATVYAHELGHIVHWDFAVMTLAATLVQVTYLLYVAIDELAHQVNDKKFREGARTAAWAAYILYIIGEYLLLYLSRTREYYADHFAAEVTGNPNALSRALVKIAYGILEEGKRNQEPSKILAGTRALGIADPKSAAFTGTAYRVASEPQKVGRVFLWDMFNPWAWWMELNSTHPLTGKRVRALTTYAEQLGLETEFDMAQVVREGRSLNKRKLYSNFALDVFLFWADWICMGVGLALGGVIVFVSSYVLKNSSPDLAGIDIFLKAASPAMIGFGFGTLLKMVFMYPDFSRAPATDVLTLMSDPYASPLRGRAVQLSGEVIGRGDSGYIFGSDLKLQDPTGLIYLRYASRFGPLGNFLFGMTQADSFIRQEVSAVGWFRRGIMPWVDLVRMDCPAKWRVTSHPRFWLLVEGVLLIALGFAMPMLLTIMQSAAE